MVEKRKDTKGRVLQKGENQRPDGRYQYRYTDSLGNRCIEYSWRLVPTDRVPEGKKQDLSLREKEKEIQKKLDNGLIIDKTSLNDMFDYYLKRKKHKGKMLKDSTLYNYKSMWEKNIKEKKIAKMKICDIKRKHIINLFFELQEKEGLSYGTIKFFYRLLNAIFNIAIDDDIILVNPVKRTLNEISGTERKRDALTIAQQEELLNYAKINNYSIYVKIFFMIESMCRISELAGLTWSNIDFQKRIITINHQLQYIKSKEERKCRYKITSTKSESGNRKIPMTDNIYMILKEMKQCYFINKQYEVDGYTNFVFLSEAGRLLRINNFNQELKNLLDLYNKTAQNKIDNISSHILRHTGCTRKAEKGMDIKVLQYLMGHNNSSITMEIYNHANEDRVKMAMIKADMGKIGG